MTFRPRGCVPILLTPFHDDGAIDLESLGREIEFLISSGVSGLASPAIASEGYKLSDEERILVSREVITRVAGRVPVLISVDAHGTDPAVDKARQAAAWGADALMVLPPSFVKPDEVNLISYYSRIADAAQVPIMVQDAPQLTGVTISVDALKEMNSRNPLLNSVKLEGLPAGPKTSAVINFLANRMDVFVGWGGLGLMEGLARGAVGCMPAANLAPVLTRVIDLYEAGEHQAAADAFGAAIPFMSWSMQSIDLGIWAAKEQLQRAGIIKTATTREPCLAPDAVIQAEFNRLADSTDFSLRY